MDRALVLDVLGLSAQDWGPSFGAEFSHAEFSATWRGVSACPSEESMLLTWRNIASSVAMQAVHDERKRLYPSVGDQLDALWKGGKEAEDMKAVILEIKARVPKP